MNSRHQPVSLLQASQKSPLLAKLVELSADSTARLKAIESLIPPGLRSCVQAGPIEGETWCLLLSNNAAASKVRQLLPSFEAQLRNKGWSISAIRMKVQVSRDRR